MENRIKVLVISDYRDTLSARPEVEIFIRLQSPAIDITVMTYEDAEYIQRLKACGVKVIPFHPVKKFSRKEIRFIRQELIRGQYDILHLFNSKAIINGLQAAKKLPVKVILYRGVSVNVNWYDPSAYLKYLHPRVDKIICVAEKVKEHIDRNSFFAKNKTITILKGHSPDWYNAVKPADLQSLNIPAGAFVVVNVANARPMKGIPYLIRSAGFLPPNLPVHYLLIGSNMDCKDHMQLIKASPYKNNFHVMGRTKDPLPYVKASDIFVLSSISSEGLNKTTIEAMGLGITPVVTDIAENKNLVIHEMNGLVIPVKNPEAIAKAILKLYQNPELCKSYGEKSKEYVKNRLNIDLTVEKFRHLYDELLKK